LESDPQNAINVFNPLILPSQGQNLPTLTFDLINLQPPTHFTTTSKIHPIIRNPYHLLNFSIIEEDNCDSISFPLSFAGARPNFWIWAV
jgi:hypothetical protein